MRRRLGLLLAATWLAAGGAIAAAGPAAAVAPPPSGDQHDCRLVSVCWPGQHRGWDTPPRNVGG